MAGAVLQVQHLRAYADPSASADSLAYPVVDPRFSYVRKGAAPVVEYLGIQENPNHKGWASGANYGAKILRILAQILQM